MDDFFKTFRQSNQLTQGEMAKRLGISRQALYALEKGSSKPSLDLIAKMEALFDASWRDFFPEMSQKHPWQKIKPLKEPGLLNEKKESKINNFEDKGGYYSLEVYFPNIKKEDVELEIGKGQLIIRVQKVEEETRQEDKISFYYQIASSSMQRTFALPEEINQEKTEAKFENDVLKMKLYKLNPKADSKIIRFE